MKKKFWLSFILIFSFALRTVFAQEIDSSMYKIYDYNVDNSRRTIQVRQFEYSLFLKEALFRDATFYHSASFRWTHFDSTANFMGAKFYKNGIYDNVDFEKGKFFSYANFMIAEFYSESSFIDSEFYSYANFVGSKFNHISTFRGAFFDDRVNFKKSYFYSLAHFINVHFDSLANFGGVEFGNEVDFSGAIFKSKADFKSENPPIEAHFFARSHFEKVQFESVANFEGVTFDSLINFEKTSFLDTANFSQARFNGRTDFSFSKFNNIALFNNTTFKGEVNLTGCLLPDTLYFNAVESEEVIDFTYALTDTTNGSNKKCVIDIYGTDIKKIKIDYSRFSILIDSNRYTRPQLSSIYQQVLKMQQENGFVDGEEVVDKEYRHFKLTYGKKGNDYIWGKIQSDFYRLWWDYGYAKSRIYKWTLLAILMLTIFNFFPLDDFNQNVYEVKKLKVTEIKKNYILIPLGKLNLKVPYIQGRLHLRFIDSFYYTSLIFFGLRLNVDHINFNNRGKAFWIIFQYTLGLFCLAYIANFIIISQ